MMCICGGAGKIYAEREILLCFDERFPMGVIHTGFPYRQETAGERFPAAVMHYGLPYRQETLLQNVLTLVHYHLVLWEGNKKSLSAGKPTGFWREGKLLSRKSKVKMIRINAPPFLRLAAVFPFIMGIWIGEIFCFAFSWPSVNLCTYYITFSPSCKPSFTYFSNFLCKQKRHGCWTTTFLIIFHNKREGCLKKQSSPSVFEWLRPSYFPADW